MRTLFRLAGALHIILCVMLVPRVVGAQSCVSPDVDADLNGFRDRYEQMLAYMFCPSLALHSGEESVFGVATTPEPVEIVTGSLWRELHYLSNGSYQGEQDISGLLSEDYSWIDNSLDYQAPPVPTFNCGTSAVSWAKYHFDYAGPSLESVKISV